MSQRTSEDELLAAYAADDAALDGDDRRRVDALLARSPDARAELAATRAVLRRIRALPQPAAPDLSRAIAAAVGDRVPRAWWRQWRWLVPIGALAATAVAALIWFQQPARRDAPHGVATTHDAGVSLPHADEPNAPAVDAIWLAGQIVELSEASTINAQLDDLDRDVRELLAADDDDVTGGILPATDLRWIDNLDDNAIDRAERWLAKAKT